MVNDIDYNGRYMISTFGNVLSMVDAIKSGKANPAPIDGVLLGQSIQRGYLTVCLSLNGQWKNIKVHRLVAIHFIKNDDPDGNLLVNNKDENKLNNIVTNLEWCNNKYNLEYGTAMLRRAASQTKPFVQFTLDGIPVKIWFRAGDAFACGFNQSCVCDCLNGKRKNHGGYLWKFLSDCTQFSCEEIQLLKDAPNPKYYPKDRRKAVVQLTIDGKFVRMWSCAQEAQRCGYTARAITGVCRGRVGSHAGYLWMYQDDYEQSVKSKEIT